MNLRLSTALVAVAVYVAVILVLSGFRGPPGSAEQGVVDPNDCTTFSPPPTVSPSPTPSPPFTPFRDRYVCNDTGLPVSDLHIVLNKNTKSPDLQASMTLAGCPSPSIVYTPGPDVWTQVDIDWGSACVASGKQVGARFFADCTTPQPGCVFAPQIACFYWTQSGNPVVPASPYQLNPPICPFLSPSPTPGVCPARATPPVTHPPTPTPASATPTPGPTSRDAIIITNVPFCNDAGQAASDLHVQFAFPYSNASVQANPSGCPEAMLDEGAQSFDRYRMDIDWGVACVDPGESVALQLLYACGDVPCSTPQPYCYDWTLFGSPLLTEGDCQQGEVTPTPTPAPTPAVLVECAPAPSNGPTSPGTTPSPSPQSTPLVDRTVWTFTNETGEASSDLHASYSDLILPSCLMENAPGCPAPANDRSVYNVLNLDWGVACVGPGEVVKVLILSEPPSYRTCYYWTVFGEPIGNPCVVTPTPTPTPTPAPPAPLQGDVNCDNEVNGVDALLILRKNAGLSVQIPDQCVYQGDVDCSGLGNAIDALKIMRHVLSLPISQNQPCSLIGQPR